MKIAVAGSHGTGKSSFAKGLAKKLQGNYIYDIVREEAVPNDFPINEKTSPEVQLWLIARQWELEKITPEPWVADKCLFDYLVYGELLLKKDTGSKAGKIREAVKAIVEDNAFYDFVFYLPIEFPMELDGLRSEDLDFQKQADKAYKSCLEEFGIKYITLSSWLYQSRSKEEAVEKRINQALKHLNLQGKQKDED